jgi:hypothetical protein
MAEFLVVLGNIPEYGGGVPLPTEEHLGCFQVLVMTSKAAGLCVVLGWERYTVS